MELLIAEISVDIGKWINNKFCEIFILPFLLACFKLPTATSNNYR